MATASGLPYYVKKQCYCLDCEGILVDGQLHNCTRLPCVPSENRKFSRCSHCRAYFPRVHNHRCGVKQTGYDENESDVQSVIAVDIEDELRAEMSKKQSSCSF